MPVTCGRGVGQLRRSRNHCRKVRRRGLTGTISASRRFDAAEVGEAGEAGEAAGRGAGIRMVSAGRIVVLSHSRSVGSGTLVGGAGRDDGGRGAEARSVATGFTGSADRGAPPGDRHAVGESGGSGSRGLGCPGLGCLGTRRRVWQAMQCVLSCSLRVSHARQVHRAAASGESAVAVFPKTTRLGGAGAVAVRAGLGSEQE